MLQDRAQRSVSAGYAKQKWITFCEDLIGQGYKINLYEAKTTFSKYVTVMKGGKEYKVRFSNHKPNRSKELGGDCDFFVGVTNTGVRTTDDAMEAVRKYFK